MPNRRQRLREAGREKVVKVITWLSQEQWASRQAEQFRDGCCEPWESCVLPWPEGDVYPWPGVRRAGARWTRG